MCYKKLCTLIISTLVLRQESHSKIAKNAKPYKSENND